MVDAAPRAARSRSPLGWGVGSEGRDGSKAFTGCHLTSERSCAPYSAIIARRTSTGKRQSRWRKVRKSANRGLRKSGPHLRTRAPRQESARRHTSPRSRDLGEVRSTLIHPLAITRFAKLCLWRYRYTASLQKRRNSHDTQRARFVGGGGIRSAATITRIASTACPTLRRKAGVIMTSSALRSGK